MSDKLGPFDLNEIYCMDCLEAMLQLPDGSCVVVTDPPYGIGESNEKNATRGKLAAAKDYGHYEWDSKPMSAEQQSELMRTSREQVIFGGNYFDLPPSSSWIVWDKVNGDSDFADCELAWTSHKRAVRLFRWRWVGMLQEKMGAQKELRSHPTQKPLALMKWVIENYTKPEDIIFDPFSGSGTTLVAAKQLGRRYLGFEIEPKYVEIARKRLAQEELF